MKRKGEPSALAVSEDAQSRIQLRGLNSDARGRVRKAVFECGGPKAFSAKSGIALSTLNQVLSGRSEPKANLLALIAEHAGVSIDWIMFGDEKVAPDTRQPPASLRPSDILEVAFYDVRASAGPGAMPLTENPTEVFGIDRRFAEAAGITASDVIALPVQGDSGQPGLFEGDMILVDRALQELRDGMLYVIGVDNDVVVKRVHRQMDRSVVLRSDNPAYEPQHVSAADVERLRVIGRVRWAMRGM